MIYLRESTVCILNKLAIAMAILSIVISVGTLIFVVISARDIETRQREINLLKQQLQKDALAVTNDLPELTASPDALNFGTIKYELLPRNGSIGRGETITITNSGTSTVRIGSAVEGGANRVVRSDGALTLLGDVCIGRLLKPDETCDFTVSLPVNPVNTVPSEIDETIRIPYSTDRYIRELTIPIYGKVTE